MSDRQVRATLEGSVAAPHAAGHVPEQFALDSAAASSDPAGVRVGISNAISRVHKRFTGRGPNNTRVTIDGDLVVCLLEGGFTQDEQTLAAHRGPALVSDRRRALHSAMRPAMIAAVEQITGRRVRSFMSGNDLEHELQADVFVLTRKDPAELTEPG